MIKGDINMSKMFKIIQEYKKMSFAKRLYIINEKSHLTMDKIHKMNLPYCPEYVITAFIINNAIKISSFDEKILENIIPLIKKAFGKDIDIQSIKINCLLSKDDFSNKCIDNMNNLLLDKESKVQKEIILIILCILSNLRNPNRTIRKYMMLIRVNLK